MVDNPTVRKVLTVEEGITALEKVYENKYDILSFDYEGTGLKPHREEQELKTVAFSYKENYAVAMPIFDDWRFKDLLQLILKDSNIKLTAHSMKFEHMWSQEKIKVTPNGWDVDTMLSAHILDNRSGITSLKFQTCVNFGVAGYDKEVEKWIKSTKDGEDPKSGNRLNKIDEADLETVLHYDGLDAIYGLKLANKHKHVLSHSNDLKRAYDLFHNGILAFAEIEQKGWSVNLKHYDQSERFLQKNLTFWKKAIAESKEVKKFKELNNTDVFNQRSTKQKQNMFFDILKCKSIKETKKRILQWIKKFSPSFQANTQLQNILRRNKELKD